MMKFAVDTSFIIGLFMSEKKMLTAKDLFYRLKEDREKVYVPIQTISEVVEVLENKYTLDRKVIYDYIIAILSNYVFYVEKCDLFYRAMEHYLKKPGISIKKILIAEETKERKISKIISMDNGYEELNILTIKNI